MTQVGAPSVNTLPPSRLIPAGALLLFACCATLAHRDGIRLSFDSYYYVELAKMFRAEFPHCFGNAWPFGWPLIGTAGTFLGISTYHSLLAAGVFSTAVLIFLTSSHLPWDGQRKSPSILLLAAGASLFIVHALVVGALSEIPFAAILLTFGIFLGHWPRPDAILAASVFALLGFSFRYVGAIAVGVLAVWFVINFETIKAAGKVRFTAIVLAGVITIACLLLRTNLIASGHLSGSDRGQSSPLREIPSIVSDFGWSGADACIGLAAQKYLGYYTPVRTLIGLFFYSLPLIIAISSWRRNDVPHLRPLAIVVAAYCIGFVVLRVSGEFDSLSPRIAVPIIFPILILLAWQPVEKCGKIYLTACTFLILWNVALAIRGASTEIGADVRKAAASIRSDLRNDDVVGINDYAFTLAAMVDVRVERTVPRPDISFGRYRFLVLAGRPSLADGGQSAIQPEWLTRANSLVQSGRFTTRWHTPDLLVLESAPLIR